MASTECAHCGREVTAADPADLVGVMMQHVAADHPGLRPLAD